MSDFTDDEDRQLVQLAREFLRNVNQILWDQLTKLMERTRKSKEELRQRLKTLKRTHGTDIEKFPSWYFKTQLTTNAYHRQLQSVRRTSGRTKTHARERGKEPPKQSRYKRRERATETKLSTTGTPTKMSPKKTPNRTISPRLPKSSLASKIESLSSLQLLASVASISGQGEEVADYRCARV